MRELLYVVAFVLLAAGATMGDKLDRGYIVNRPRNPVPLRVITGASGLAGIGWFIYGFFPFSWWLPFVAVVAFAVVGAFLAYRALRSGHGPAAAILSSILGFATAIGVAASGV